MLAFRDVSLAFWLAVSVRMLHALLTEGAPRLTDKLLGTYLMSDTWASRWKNAGGVRAESFSNLSL